MAGRREIGRCDWVALNLGRLSMCRLRMMSGASGMRATPLTLRETTRRPNVAGTMKAPEAQRPNTPNVTTPCPNA